MKLLIATSISALCLIKIPITMILYRFPQRDFKIDVFEEESKTFNAYINTYMLR